MSNQNRHIKTVLTGTACVGEAKKEYRGRYSVTYHHTLGNLYQENEKKMSTLLYTQLYSSTSELSVCIDVVEKERDHPSIVVILCTFNFDNGRHHQLLGGWKRYLKDSASQCTSFYYYSAFSALLYRPKDRYSVYSTVGLSAPHRKVKICWWWGGGGCLDGAAAFCAWSFFATTGSISCGSVPFQTFFKVLAGKGAEKDLEINRNTYSN